MKTTTFLLFLSFFFSLSAAQTVRGEGDIIIGSHAPQLEQFATRELQRYLFQLSGTLLRIRDDGTATTRPSFVIGQPKTNALIRDLVSERQLDFSTTDPGPQGYILKKLMVNKATVIVIAGSDDVGCLYGVYGLLADYYHIGFFLGGDILPDTKSPLIWVDADEKKTPTMYIRGFLPWTNFPQSATSYSWEDWKFILDQMAKMRLNFIHIHNYNGELGHNEMYHNFTYRGYTSRVWMPTARQAHAWAMSPWDVNKYRFGAADLFDDYDFGADCALHNENLTNEEVFRKSASLFQKVIDYAHSRGIKVGLGLDIDLIPRDYKAKADDPEVIQARLDQLVNDYPDLDYLLCFQSENVGKDPQFYQAWRKIFTGFYEGVKARMPHTRVAVAGWGLNPASIATLPEDVICAPISYYLDRCETGAIYGDREYWGCPWLERDFYSSEYYYPYNLHLSNTIAAFKERAPNMKGFYCLTWRLTDAIEPKMGYIARAPWDNTNELGSSRNVYLQYARLAYGPEAAPEIADIIDRNEPFACDYAECEGTPPFDRLEARGIFQVEWFRLSGEMRDSATEYNAASFSEQFGIGKNRCEEGGECVDWIDSGDWARYAGINFGLNATTFEARVASATEGGIIEIRLDSLSGPLIGTCVVTNTGGLQRWATVHGTIKSTSGRHTLQLNFVSTRDPFGDYQKAVNELRVIDKWIGKTHSPTQRARLELLRCRIAAAKDHIELNKNFGTYKWADLPGATESWTRNFTQRVTDISSLGNVMSMQNRYVQRNYVAKEETLRNTQRVKAPSGVTARGTKRGVLLQWNPGDSSCAGFNVYRDGKKINDSVLPNTTSAFTEAIDGVFTYQVTAIGAHGNESPPSVPAICEAGSSDTTPPFAIAVSPPGSHPEGEPVWVKVRLLDIRAYDEIAAKLFYRKMGEMKWTEIPMERKVKAIFAAEIPSQDVTGIGLEYYVEATDGKNLSVYPASGPEMPLSITTYVSSWAGTPLQPSGVQAKEQVLSWDDAGKDVFWYRVYRSRKSDFKAAPANFVTYVAAGTTKFKDNGKGFDGTKLQGDWYYRVKSMNRAGFESKESKAIRIDYPE